METIVTLDGEGGSFKSLGEKHDDAWKLIRERNEKALADLLDEEDADLLQRYTLERNHLAQILLRCLFNSDVTGYTSVQ